MNLSDYARRAQQQEAQAAFMRALRNQQGPHFLAMLQNPAEYGLDPAWVQSQMAALENGAVRPGVPTPEEALADPNRYGMDQGWIDAQRGTPTQTAPSTGGSGGTGSTGGTGGSNGSTGTGGLLGPGGKPGGTAEPVDPITGGPRQPRPGEPGYIPPVVTLPPDANTGGTPGFPRMPGEPSNPNLPSNPDPGNGPGRGAVPGSPLASFGFSRGPNGELLPVMLQQGGNPFQQPQQNGPIFPGGHYTQPVQLERMLYNPDIEGYQWFRPPPPAQGTGGGTNPGTTPGTGTGGGTNPGTNPGSGSSGGSGGGYGDYSPFPGGRSPLDPYYDQTMPKDGEGARVGHHAIIGYGPDGRPVDGSWLANNPGQPYTPIGGAKSAGLLGAQGLPPAIAGLLNI